MKRRTWLLLSVRDDWWSEIASFRRCFSARDWLLMMRRRKRKLTDVDVVESGKETIPHRRDSF